MASKAKKSSSVQDKWFEDSSFKGIIQHNHPQNSDNGVYCLLCQKVVDVSHQGKTACKLASQRKQPTISSIFHPRTEALETQIRRAEVKMVGFLAEHNLPLAVADHIGPLVKDIFPDSKIAKGYQCSRTKATCILNRAIKPELQRNLITQMRESCYSICTDSSNDQNLGKMNPVTVRLFDINQHKVATKFLDVCLSKVSTAVGIFTSINNVFQKYDIPWENCISLGVDNTSVNVGRDNSLST